MDLLLTVFFAIEHMLVVATLKLNICQVKKTRDPVIVCFASRCSGICSDCLTSARRAQHSAGPCRTVRYIQTCRGESQRSKGGIASMEKLDNIENSRGA